ncbi:hypothetical protein WAJ10_20950, partial [Acinetobacter baumannii]
MPGNGHGGGKPVFRESLTAALRGRCPFPRGCSMSDLIEPVIGVIGGSGLYDIDGLVEREW